MTEKFWFLTRLDRLVSALVRVLSRSAETAFRSSGSVAKGESRQLRASLRDRVEEGCLFQLHSPLGSQEVRTSWDHPSQSEGVLLEVEILHVRVCGRKNAELERHDTLKM